MRDIGRVNRAVTSHWVRRLMGKAPKRTPGVSAGGGLWKKIAGVLQPVDAPDVVDVEVGTLHVSDLLRLINDHPSAPTVAASLELKPVFVILPASGDDIALPEGSVFIVTDAGGATTITGFASGSRYGRTVVLVNESSVPRTLQHNVTSTTGNRLSTPNGDAIVWEQGDVFVLQHMLTPGGPTAATWYVMPLKKGARGASRFGARWVDYVDEELITCASGTRNHDSAANLLHANSRILSVVGRVNVAPGGASTFDVGNAAIGQTTRFATGISSAVTTPFVGINHDQGSVATDVLGPVQVAAAPVRITTNVNTTDALGRIRVVVFGRTYFPPTS